MFILINLIFILESHLYQIDDPVNSFVRLTPNDTLHFESLSFGEKSNFFQNLTKQLAEIIPIPDNRIIINDYYYCINILITSHKKVTKMHFIISESGYY